MRRVQHNQCRHFSDPKKNQTERRVNETKRKEKEKRRKLAKTNNQVELNYMCSMLCRLCQFDISMHKRMRIKCVLINEAENENLMEFRHQTTQKKNISFSKSNSKSNAGLMWSLICNEISGVDTNSIDISCIRKWIKKKCRIKSKTNTTADTSTITFRSAHIKPHEKSFNELIRLRTCVIIDYLRYKFPYNFISIRAHIQARIQERSGCSFYAAIDWRQHLRFNLFFFLVILFVFTVSTTRMEIMWNKKKTFVFDAFIQRNVEK